VTALVNTRTDCRKTYFTTQTPALSLTHNLHGAITRLRRTFYNLTAPIFSPDYRTTPMPTRSANRTYWDLRNAYRGSKRFTAFTPPHSVGDSPKTTCHSCTACHAATCYHRHCGAAVTATCSADVLAAHCGYGLTHALLSAVPASTRFYSAHAWLASGRYLRFAADLAIPPRRSYAAVRTLGIRDAAVRTAAWRMP